MKKIVNLYYEEKLVKANSYSTGFVFELEDGSYVVHHQDGYVVPTTVFTDRSVYDEWFKKTVGQE